MRVPRGLFPISLLMFVTVQAQIRVIDDLGRTITLSAPARRVVSLAPSLTESLFAIGAGGQVAGITTFCNYPDGTRVLPRVGGMTNPSIERIVSLSPDLVLVSIEGNTRADFTRITTLAIPVYVSNPRTLMGIYRSLTDLGSLTGRSDEAQRLVDSLKHKEEMLRSMVSRTPVSTLFLISLHPLIVAGKNTLLNELLALAGARNIAADLEGNYPAISREAILAENPDVLFMTADLAGDTEHLISLFPEWSQLNAIRQKKVYRLDTDIVSRPGPRALLGLELVLACLHGGTQ